MRLLNRPLALLLAAALGAVGVIVIVEVVAAALNVRPIVVPWPTWYHWAARTRWDRTVIKVWSAVLLAAGVILLAAELKPPRATRLPLDVSDDATDAALTNSGLAGTLRAAATSIDGITAADVVVRRHRVHVTARCAARGRTAASAFHDPVSQAVRGRLDSLELRRPPRLTTRVAPRSR